MRTRAPGGTEANPIIAVPRRLGIRINHRGGTASFARQATLIAQGVSWAMMQAG